MPLTATALAAYPARYFDAWNAQDIEMALDVIADDIEWVDPLLPAPLDSKDGARGFFEGSWAGLPDLRLEAVGEPLVDEANGRVACEWRMTGTHRGELAGIPATGKPFDVAGTDVWEIDADGRATSVHAYYDAATLMRQLGLA